ncbi:hypothetical protein FAI40_07225 [Acetobacteraceae bacterium]|nr:hypothetical protein FAI40_07225 [Acetobacteraceae bacterium]
MTETKQLTAEEDIIFTIQHGCSVLGGNKLDMERHKDHALTMIAEAARRLPEKDEGTDAQIVEQVMNELVMDSGSPERRVASHQSYAKLFARKFALLIREELTKAQA